MEYIKSWLKTILYMNVLLLICDNLMQKTAYEKYYRFFSGFLLVVCLLKPVIDFAGTEQYFQVSFLQEEWKNERNLLGNVKEFQDMQDVLKKEYDTAYKNQIEEIAKKKNIQVKKITFWWDNKKEHLKQIEIRGILLKGSDSTLHTTDNPSHVESLKKILMQLYDLEESDVFVEVE